MSRNLGYTRKFIILKKDYSNMAGLNPKGHGKLEIRGIRGNISINLENTEEDNFYNVVFIGNNTSETIGRVYTDENGKGKAELTLTLQDLESKGFPIDKINGILIIRDRNVLLGGYIEKEDNSIERFVDGLKQADMPIEIEEAVDPITEWREVETVIPELELEHESLLVADTFVEQEIEDITIYQKEAIEPTYEPLNLIIEDLEIPAEVEVVEGYNIEPEVEVVEGYNIEPEVEVVEGYSIEPEVEVVEGYNIEPEVEVVEGYNIEPEVDVVEEDNTEPEVEVVEVYEIEPEVEVVDGLKLDQETEVVEEPEIEHTDFYGEEVARRVNQKNQTTNYILNILRFFPYTDPFSVKLAGYNWWKINFQEEIDTKGFLPYFSYIVGGAQKIKRTEDYITALDLLRKYEHYIFGLYNVNDDVRYYVYGIPGDFIKAEHPHNGTTGFNTWFEGLELDGYWLLYIDPLNGKVIYPTKPMEPTN